MKVQTFLQKLQSADEPTKRVWIVASSFVIMTGVVYIWLTFFNTFATAPEVANNGGGVQAGHVSSGFSLGQTFHGIGASLYDAVADRVRAVGGFFNTSRNITIDPR
jgi:hypothetical protein